jgi:hypothetical protein
MYENSENLSYLDKINDDPFEEKLVGSNGFAFSPKLTTSGNAMLYINPHVTFYFRPEVHMVSDEGLNAYGAVTWGQFFIYQGFNEKRFGQIAVGMQADLMILEQNPLVTDPHDVAGIKIRAVYKSGVAVIG